MQRVTNTTDIDMQLPNGMTIPARHTRPVRDWPILSRNQAVMGLLRAGALVEEQAAPKPKRTRKAKAEAPADVPDAPAEGGEG